MRLHILISSSTDSSGSAVHSNSCLTRRARHGWRRCQHLLQLVYVGAAAAHVGPHFLLDAVPLRLPQLACWQTQRALGWATFYSTGQASTPKLGTPAGLGLCAWLKVCAGKAAGLD